MHRGSLPSWRRYPLPPPGGSHLLLWAASPKKRRPRRGRHQNPKQSSIAGAGRIHHPRVLLPKSYQPASVSSAALEGRGPTEMRIGLNLIRITAEAEREWQLRMQEPNADFERRAIEQSCEGRRRRSQKLQTHQQGAPRPATTSTAQRDGGPR